MCQVPFLYGISTDFRKFTGKLHFIITRGFTTVVLGGKN
jgi:hypothetical protein